MTNKKSFLIGISIVTIVFILCFLLLVIIKKTPTEEKPPIIPNHPVQYVNEDDRTIYTIQNILNNYYESLISKETNIVYSLLHETYLINNQINQNNIFNKIETDYENPTFIIEEFQGYEKNDLKYYFIKGYLISQEYTSENASLTDNLIYEIVVDNNTNTYNIIPIATSNFNNYINNYNFDEITNTTGNNKYEKLQITEKNKLISYISKFKNLLLIAPEKAYNLLGIQTKKSYLTKEDFINQKEEIFLKLSSLIFSYSKDETTEQKTYKIIDNKGNEITIKERNILNYTIDFN